MRKVTPALARKIRKLASEGGSHRQIADAVGLSCGTVGNVLRASPVRLAPAPAASPPDRPSPPPIEANPPPDVEPITEAELRVRASALLRSLQAAVDQAKAEGEPTRVASAQRMFVQALSVLARLTPEDPARDGDKVLVSAAEIAREASAFRAKLSDMLTRALERGEK